MAYYHNFTSFFNPSIDPSIDDLIAQFVLLFQLHHFHSPLLHHLHPRSHIIVLELVSVRIAVANCHRLFLDTICMHHKALVT